MADYIYTMELRLTPNQQKGVTLVQDIARAAGMNVYLTGGAVRDIISGFPIRDLDFTVQGNPLKLQKDFERVGAIIGGADDDTNTLYVTLPGSVRAEVSMARTERYEKTGKPPVITPGTLIEDLRRRDFTVNAMALSLNPGSRGLLMDPYNGAADIEAKLLRVLNNYAFVEDPSRLLRASRLSARFQLAARRAYPGPVRLGQREQLHRIHFERGHRLRNRATGLRRRSAEYCPHLRKRRLAESSCAALDRR